MAIYRTINLYRVLERLVRLQNDVRVLVKVDARDADCAVRILCLGERILVEGVDDALALDSELVLQECLHGFANRDDLKSGQSL